jgi:hypothetical protein
MAQQLPHALVARVRYFGRVLSFRYSAEVLRMCKRVCRICRKQNDEAPREVRAVLTVRAVVVQIMLWIL